MPECTKPFSLKNDQKNFKTVPCGKCANCKKKMVSAWSFRLMQEEKVSSSAYFITLTYDLEHCPISKNGFMELRKSDLQKFFKRFRYYGNVALRYFSVGEYGGRYKRPHYHLLVFNCKLELIIGDKHAKMVKRGILQLDGKTPFKCEAWSAGHITIGALTPASVGYTCKYMLKDWRPMHRNDDRQPQFRLMSKGLGLNYLTPAMVSWHKADLENRMYVNVGDGKKATMPRYIKENLFKAIYGDSYEALVAKADIGYCTRKKMIEQLEDRMMRDKDYARRKISARQAANDRLLYQHSVRDKH